MAKTENLSTGSTEWQLLVLTARLHMDTTAQTKLRGLLTLEIDWNLVISEGYRHGTIGLIYKHLKHLEGDVLQSDVTQRFRNSYLRMIAAGMLQLAQLRDLADSLNEIGCEIIVLKGASLAELTYMDLGLRTFSDVDILVKESDWPKVLSILKKLGYRSNERFFADLPPKIAPYDFQAHLQFFSPADTCVEIQFDLLTIGIGMRDIDGIWKRSRKAVVGGAQVKVLSPEDQLLHLVVHANRHGCTRLKWLVDIVETVSWGPPIDWGVLEATARRENVTAIFYLTMEHVARLLGAQQIISEMPLSMYPKLFRRILWKAVWPRRRLDRFEGRVEDAICYYYYRPFCAWNLLNYALSGRVRDKMIYQARWIVPSLSWMAETHGQKKSLRLLRYYPLRLMNRSRKNAENRGTFVKI